MSLPITGFIIEFLRLYCLHCFVRRIVHIGIQNALLESSLSFFRQSDKMMIEVRHSLLPFSFSYRKTTDEDIYSRFYPRRDDFRNSSIILYNLVGER